ncbi:hypothetical protein O6H91_08G073300 [Diphasiastrum complanatum]|uniref:Uncharacterized protein n=2 Tax=Diphasiastrum complanatum TaxID=34168 RepID=A0ACC2CYS4_DIPCM|nr:hypothetical protein O6H91_08G072800 [Diphasiastrum complanatum]KAJ7547183.1 hypothetical protein O6H91_08G073300 [Diphasiastrum complanatum]
MSGDGDGDGDGALNPALLLTEDVWRSILGRLPAVALARAACVCRRWYLIAGDPEVLSAAFKAPWKLRQIVGRPSSSRFWQIQSLKVFAISHTVQRWDTVAGLAIKYQVHITDIRQLNNMMSDHGIHSRERLLIPITSSKILEGNICYIEMDIHSRREVAVLYLDGSRPSQLRTSANLTNSKGAEKLRRKVLESMKTSMRLDEETASYYLSLSEGDLRAALSELREDLNWEMRNT